MDMMDMDTDVKVKGKVAEARLLKLRRLLIAKKTLYIIFILALASCKRPYLLQSLVSQPNIPHPNPMSHPYSCLFGDAFARPKMYFGPFYSWMRLLSPVLVHRKWPSQWATVHASPESAPPPWRSPCRGMKTKRRSQNCQSGTWTWMHVMDTQLGCI